MSFFKFVQDKQNWEKFLALEEEKEFGDKRLIKKVTKIIEKEEYLDFDEDFFKIFALPRVKRISKYNTSKKRTVYVYPSRYRVVLKMLSYYMLLKYNKDFAYHSLAYTKGKSVKTAFSILRGFNLTEHDTIYKNDFSDYFNAINLDLLEPKLRGFLKDETELADFILRILRQPRVVDNKKITMVEQKGVMAGSPIAGILANIFMHDVDLLIYEQGYKYIRYADDTIIIGEEALAFFAKEINKLEINFNPKKSEVFNITTGLTFLGFRYEGKTIDISKEAKDKMKSRFKRRAKWYRQWMKRKNVKPDVAVRDYIKKINYKLYSDQEDSINWSRWYLPNINTTESIKYLDEYFVRAIRYLYTGEWNQTKKHYSLSYDKIKEFGYKSLVNEYYKILKLGKKQKNQE